jgi:hypothetical protein
VPGSSLGRTPAALVLRPGCVSEKVGIKRCSQQKSGISVIARSEPKGVKPKMRERKLERGVKVRRKTKVGCIKVFSSSTQVWDGTSIRRRPLPSKSLTIHIYQLS